MPPSEIGKRIIGAGEELGSELNVGPAISPDGKMDRVPLRTQRVLDRSVRRRRGDRQDRAQADEHVERSALLEHPVHLLGRRLGRRQRADRDRHCHLRSRGTRHLQRAERRQAARGAAHRSRRDLQPDVVARRPRHRLHRHVARRHRSLHLRSRGLEAAAPDQRRVTPNCSRPGRPTAGGSRLPPIASRAISARSRSASTASR